MKKFISKILIIIIIIGLVLPSIAMADINKEQDKLNNLNKNIKSVQGKIKESKEEKQETKKELEKIEQQLEEANNNLEKIKTDLDSTNRALDKAKDELAKAEEAMENQNMTLSERIRVMYKNGNIGYLEVLLEAESFSDFISRIEMIKTIMEYDYELLNTLEEKKREVEDKKLEIEKEQERILTLKNKLERKAKEVKSLQVSRENKIRKIDNEIAAFEKEMKHLEEDAAKVKKIIQAAANKNNSGGSGPYTGGQLLWPVPGHTRITSPYGMRLHPIQHVYKMHTGIDIGAGRGTPVVASADGVVTYAGYLGGYGYTVIIDIGGGLSTLSAHHSSLKVSAGQSVKRGQTVALVGSTGASTGPHLHFEVRKNGNHTNPIPYLKK
ncbi:MAG TPA: peptidoglycan DD-metalloendopeptidase family protein [Eubacteriaceae bacterium]|jgi:murein DD-endopeptidase MepM/ murein hydrolase activator NlpD|nr:peptidoglycan DD-metalloendopeptidase family protein [Eubacteriaceae bacterium]